MRRFADERTILNGVQSDGFGTAILVADQRHKIITIATRELSGTETIKFMVAVSCQETAPTFSSAATYNNRWDYARVRDLQSGDAVAGDTGITITGSNEVQQLAIEDDNVQWVNVSATISDEVNSYAYAFIACANDSE